MIGPPGVDVERDQSRRSAAPVNRIGCCYAVLRVVLLQPAEQVLLAVAEL
jgi:hypothetical protein